MSVIDFGDPISCSRIIKLQKKPASQTSEPYFDPRVVLDKQVFWIWSSRIDDPLIQNIVLKESFTFGKDATHHDTTNTSKHLD